MGYAIWPKRLATHHKRLFSQHRAISIRPQLGDFDFSLGTHVGNAPFRAPAPPPESEIVRNCNVCGCGCALSEEELSQKTPEALAVLNGWLRKRAQRQRLSAAPESVAELTPLRVSSLHGWRSKVKLPVAVIEEDDDGAIVDAGLFQVGTRRLLPIHDCEAQHPSISKALRRLTRAMNEVRITAYSHDADGPNEIGSLRHVQLTVERSTGHVQLVLIWNADNAGQVAALEPLMERLLKRISRKGSVVWHSIWCHFAGTDPARSGSIWAAEASRARWLKMQGADRVKETIDGCKFSFGPAVFRQPNLETFDKIISDMKRVLKARVLKANAPVAPRLLELCGGVGVIGLSMASAAGPKARLLSSDANVLCAEDFEVNARRIFGEEPVGSGKISFHAADVAEAASFAAKGAYNFVIADPPRKGLGRDVIEVLAASPSVQTIFYLSCGPRQFCSDADALDMSGFEMTGLRCYDSLPGTEHIEVLGIFDRSRSFGHFRRLPKGRS
eukprot:TRINITY_DN101036_c0_g1_i1.p1 TRINITY_DN101036_c0_g1~~TRINITY_DN101036_c0_g1_i1.p1  ORF type:complete len:500 (+),score=57.42 TRINITY_DN101036_c0_g1_i1:60-1559(+)